MSKFQHHSRFPKPKHVQAYRFPFVCFHCRKSFKLPVSTGSRLCPQCRRPMEMLSRKFSAPRSADVAQWKKVQFLVEHGFRFYSVYRPSESGGKQSVRYPATLEQAKAFVLAFREHAHQPAVIDVY
ncbi:hypothetical protein [Pelomonas sp. BJYL3]|uniref:hypothetical protein n=1 Tax=Pelomonas sp. BJYL3 TaxID=2976697 RepID=UPI0022B5019B|nr:hypothetical protein [Pelomonas sp. BJYL3]